MILPPVDVYDPYLPRHSLEAAQGEKIEYSRARDILSLLVRANITANAKERLTDAEVLAREYSHILDVTIA